MIKPVSPSTEIYSAGAVNNVLTKASVKGVEWAHKACMDTPNQRWLKQAADKLRREREDDNR